MGQANSKVNPVYCMSELEAQYGDRDSSAVGLAATLESQHNGVLLRSQLSTSSCCPGKISADSASEWSQKHEEEGDQGCYDNNAYMKTADNTPCADKSVGTTLKDSIAIPTTSLNSNSLDQEKKEAECNSLSMKDSGFIEPNDLSSEQAHVRINNNCDVEKDGAQDSHTSNGDLCTNTALNGEHGRSDSPPLTPAEVRRQIYAANRNYTATPSPGHSYRDRSRSRSSSLMSLNCSLDSESIADIEPVSCCCRSNVVVIIL